MTESSTTIEYRQYAIIRSIEKPTTLNFYCLRSSHQVTVQSFAEIRLLAAKVQLLYFVESQPAGSTEFAMTASFGLSSATLLSS